jgi:hypothetical protein
VLLLTVSHPSQFMTTIQFLNFNGAKEARTPDPYNAIVVLYQLSYGPILFFNLLDFVCCCQVLAIESFRNSLAISVDRNIC